MTGLQISASMSRIERKYGIDLAHDAVPKSKKTAEYEQFESALRAEASRMSEFYEIFYCLENSIRKLVEDTLAESDGPSWWSGARVDEKRIKEPAELRRKKELDSRLAAELLPDSGCYSILGPKSSIEFGDSAIFWTAFYHLRFKARREAMKRQEIIETATKCANLIDQQFRLFYLENGNLTKEVLGDTGAGPIKVVA